MIRYPIIHDADWLRDQYQVQRKSILAIAAEVGCNHVTVWNALTKHGIASRGKGRPGSENPNWGGGRHKDRDGYVVVWVEGRGHVREHRYVMENYLARPLHRIESVHHINGVRDDNRIDNLQLRIGSHGPGQVHRCADCGSDRIIHEGLPQ